MATGHWITAKGAQFLMQGGWDDVAGTNIKQGLLAGSQPASLDTLAEVSNLDFVSSLLALATECTATGYARQTLTRSAATEDDTNDRSNLDASDVAYGNLGGATNNTLVGTFTYDEGGGTDATRTLISVEWWPSTLTTNGGPITVPVADYYRGVPV
jgi:hypothetical protein